MGRDRRFLHYFYSKPNVKPSVLRIVISKGFMSFRQDVYASLSLTFLHSLISDVSECTPFTQIPPLLLSVSLVNPPTTSRYFSLPLLNLTLTSLAPSLNPSLNSLLNLLFSRLTPLNNEFSLLLFLLILKDRIHWLTYYPGTGFNSFPVPPPRSNPQSQPSSHIWFKICTISKDYVNVTSVFRMKILNLSKFKLWTKCHDLD